MDCRRYSPSASSSRGTTQGSCRGHPTASDAGKDESGVRQAVPSAVIGNDCIAAMAFLRITVDPKQMCGVPCIRNLRIPVATVVEMIADGMSDSEILRAYPDLEPDDIQEALRFAAEARTR